VDTLRVLGAHGGGVGALRPARARRALVALQVGGSTVFLVLAGLLVQSYAHLGVADLGFDRDHLLVAELDPAAYGRGAAAARQYVDHVSEQARALPGVRDVALADRAPFYIGFERRSMVWPAVGTCAPGSCPAYQAYAVGSEYFGTMGIPFVEGRAFAATDGIDAIVVTRSLATVLWPDASAVGRTLRIGDTGTPVHVVGVVADTHTRGLGRAEPVFFRPLATADMSGPLTLLVRTEGAPASLVRPLHAAALAVDPDVPPTIKTMADRSAVQLWPFRMASAMFATCGSLALVLAVVGLGSVVRHSVSRRMREFGVRVSMGATQADLMRHVLGNGLALLAPGLGVGLAAAAALAQLARSVIVGVDVLNPVVYVVMAGVQTAVTVIACVGPALAAARTDPLAALRTE
jgi:predicted permease